MSRYAFAAGCFFHVAVVSVASAQTPLGTSFTYQGRLGESGSPANGTYDFRFRLFDTPSGGNQVGADVTRDNVVVSTGLFTVGIDFGAVFGNQRRFLEIGVRPGASTGAYDVLSGRQELSAAPTALFGASAPWTGVTGKPAGFADDVDNDSGGDITGVAAGPGLSGGGPNGNVTLSANFGGTGAAATVARSDHDHFGQAWAPVTAPAVDGLLVITNDTTANRSGIFGIHAATSAIGYGIRGRTLSASGTAVFGEATATAAGSAAYGVRGTTTAPLGVGVWGAHTAGGTGLGWGVQGTANSGSGRGVLGRASATTGLAYGVEGISDSSTGRGVGGRTTSTGGEAYGVHGVTASSEGRGVWGEATSIFGPTWGVRGSSASSTGGRGVYGEATATTGFVIGVNGVTASTGGVGVQGRATATVGNNYGVFGANDSIDGGGVYGRAEATTGNTMGVLGVSWSTQGTGVYGAATSTGPLVSGTRGVFGESRSPLGGVGVYGLGASTTGLNYGVYGRSASPAGFGGFFEAADDSNYAGFFQGRAHVNGILSKSAGLFRIDHPLDPENKFLNHSFVESPDMMNVYNGNVTTDADGYATVQLPDWFEALNRDFRYQLTVLDEGDSAVFVQVKVVKKVEANRFTIRSSMPRAEVSWQITGVRHDRFAEKRRPPVEEEKPAAWRGKYLNPVEWGVPKERGIHYSQPLSVPPEGSTRSEEEPGWGSR
jgi:hypothetical protein